MTLGKFQLQRYWSVLGFGLISLCNIAQCHPTSISRTIAPCPLQRPTNCRWVPCPWCRVPRCYTAVFGYWLSLTNIRTPIGSDTVGIPSALSAFSWHCRPLERTTEPLERTTRAYRPGRRAVSRPVYVSRT
ncbi:hypothetical protein EXIGLDRAFT_356853 [Exidia glandulosa HHB12029]|uniref:Secreted protein n=1 Tax=Exidia glandulosa HHB12029 TaxID=1314781 RepID=A0A165AZ51_EXIGL|nr:hypothetical protein EXIGLDRAFT_464248 [Exidia glandulosa HHB12029]KZV82076.1 hypothetical protein EXIGLDRAFT_356853 [Exidia glandulosa HHB12029]